MDSRDNSKELQQLQTFDNQEKYTSHYLLFTPNSHIHSRNLYPMNFNVLENSKVNSNTDNSTFFLPGKGYSDVLHHEEHSFENYSDTDSSSEVDGEESDEEVSLDELLHDEKAKNKIELLAAMVGVDTKEPAVVLTEVVRVLKLLKRVNQYPVTIST